MSSLESWVLEQPSWNLRIFVLPSNARASTSYSSTYQSSDTTAWIFIGQMPPHERLYFMQKKSLKESNKSLQKLRMCLARSIKVVNIYVKSVVLMSRWSWSIVWSNYTDGLTSKTGINCLSRRVTKVENPSKWK